MHILQRELAKEQLYQEIEDILGTDEVGRIVANKTKLLGDAKLHPSIQMRMSCLARIPFKAIITTCFVNWFDGNQCVSGTAETMSSYFESILRPDPGICCLHPIRMYI